MNVCKYTAYAYTYIWLTELMIRIFSSTLSSSQKCKVVFFPKTVNEGKKVKAWHSGRVTRMTGLKCAPCQLRSEELKRKFSHLKYFTRLNNAITGQRHQRGSNCAYDSKRPGIPCACVCKWMIACARSCPYFLFILLFFFNPYINSFIRFVSCALVCVTAICVHTGNAHRTSVDTEVRAN